MNNVPFDVHGTEIVGWAEVKGAIVLHYMRRGVSACNRYHGRDHEFVSEETVQSSKRCWECRKYLGEVMPAAGSKKWKDKLVDRVLDRAGITGKDDVANTLNARRYKMLAGALYKLSALELQQLGIALEERI